ncbi:protein unc-45 homolog B-like [Uloborus diversus]|uniref:protein unc-45 homolog B-like n=1 Tax=Uloborus diversus TaxID=327109 RepID=UPI0024098328|nr:protein unc-45 homolog B-like [Uloborus diversus]XP_054707045.1 protein unc-45 homolog B-like [Uloborus diversus]XP_054707047.1 protein unc-45 homolog B-like [Uloborus diversus]
MPDVVQDAGGPVDPREEGNALFSRGDWKGAARAYTRGLRECGGGKERATLLKNRAAAYLKTGDYEKVVRDTDEALELCPSDVKALFRRCQAREALGQFSEAFKDARAVHHLDPKNAAVQPILTRLNVKLQEKAKEQASTLNKVKSMFDYLLGEDVSQENRVQAANNLLVLSKEKAGAELIMAQSGVPKLLAAMKLEKNEQISMAIVRILSELCKKDTDRTLVVLGEVGVPFLVENLNSFSEEYVACVQYLVQVVLDSLSGMDLREGKKPDKVLMKENEAAIDGIMGALVGSVSARTMSAEGRDAILELIMKNVEYGALNWATKLVRSDGLWNMLEVSSELREIRYESSMRVSGRTPTHVAVALERVYDSMDHDRAREEYRTKVMEFIGEKLKGPDIESKVRATAVITALLQGPLDVGNHCLGQKGVVEMMLAMANSDDELQQRVAAEAIIAAAAKKDKCTTIVSMGTDILKKLYQSKNDAIKVRALVGLCKVGSSGGFDASVKLFSEGSSMKLAHACRKFLVNPKKDKDLRKWAVEGLSYLTLDADVKEELIRDEAAMAALFELARTGDLSVVYGCVTTLVNLTNSYDQEEMIPELVELAKFAKQHVPETHIKDSKEFTEARVRRLTELGVTPALVSLAKSESKNSRELISRVFNAICEQPDLRGAVVQQGGAKVLVGLALEGTDKGKLIAAQALSRIAITIDPEVAFPGQRCAEVVRPIMALLHPECKGLQNFEALMALTNLAQVSPSVRQRILKDSGITKIEDYMFQQDHVMLGRAATQCIANMMLSDEVVHLYELEDNDRVKFLVLSSDDEDPDTAKAASGCLAMLTGVSRKACKKVLQVKQWHEIVRKLCACGDKELCHRGVAVAHNLVHAGGECAERVVETDLLEILMALVRPEVDDVPQKVKDLAAETLAEAQRLRLIRANTGGQEEDEEEA